MYLLLVNPTVNVQVPVIGAVQWSNARLMCDVEAFPFPSNYWIKDQDGILLNGLENVLFKKCLYPRLFLGVSTVSKKLSLTTGLL